MNSHNQHYTINDLSNLSNLSNNTYGSITNEEIKKEIISHKQSIEAQKRLPNNSNNQIIYYIYNIITCLLSLKKYSDK